MTGDPKFDSQPGNSQSAISVDTNDANADRANQFRSQVTDSSYAEFYDREANDVGDRWLPASLASYVEIPFRHKRTIITSVLVGMLVGWLAILVCPRKYQSEAKLKIRIGRSSVALDPTVTTGETMLMQKTLEEEVVTTLDVLGSRQVLVNVVDEIGPSAVLNGYVPGGPGDEEDGVLSTVVDAARELVFNGLYLIGLKDDVSDHELAVMEIGNQLNVYAPKKSSVLTIHGEAKTPEMAQLMTQTMITVFMDEHLRSSATPGSLGFFGSEVEVAEKRLDAMNQARFEFLTKEKMVSVDANRAMLRDKLVALNRDILTAKSTLELTRAKIADLNSKIARMDDEVVVSRQQQSSSTWSGIRQRVYELEVDERNFSAIYQTGHPTLVTAREKLEGARGILKRIEAEDVSENSAINPAKAKAQEALLDLENAVAGLESEIAEKQKDQKEADAEVSRLLENERKMIDMDRNIAVLESSLSLLNQKREESRLIEQLEQKDFSNVSVVQPASLIQRPISPNKPLFALAFTLLGGMIGLTLAYAKENSFESIRSDEQLRSMVRGAPVTQIEVGGEKKRTKRDRETYRTMLLDAIRKSRGSNSGANSGRMIGVLGCHEGCGSTTVAQSLRDVGAQEFFNDISLLDWSGIRFINDEKSFHQWDEKLTELSSSNDLVIVDLPPAHCLHHTQILDKLDQVLIVVESDVTTASAVKRTVALFADPHTPDIANVVFNKSRRYLPRFVERLLKPGVTA